MSCEHSGEGQPQHVADRYLHIITSAINYSILLLITATYPGILFIRTIVLIIRAAMFLHLGRTCLARTFQSAKHMKTHKYTLSKVIIHVNFQTSNIFISLQKQADYKTVCQHLYFFT